MHTINHNVISRTFRQTTLLSILHSYQFLLFLLLTFLTTLVHSAGSPVPGPRTNHCAATWTDPTTTTYLYVYGGTGDSDSSPFSRIKLPLSSPQANASASWSSLSQDKMLVLSEAACVISPDNKYFLVIGGAFADGSLPTSQPISTVVGIQVYDLQNDVWIAPPIVDLPPDAVGPQLVGRKGLVATSYSAGGLKRVVVYGGSHPNGTDDGQFRTFILNMDTGSTWTWIPRSFDSHTPPALRYPGITQIGDNVLIIGGQQLNNQGTPVAVATEIYTFDVKASRWGGKSGRSLKVPACLTCQIAVGNSNSTAFYVIPGVSSTNSSLANVQFLNWDKTGKSKQSTVLQPTDADNTYAPKSPTFAYATFKDILYIHGTNLTINNIVQFNLASGTWTQDASSLVSNNPPSNSNDPNGNSPSGGSSNAKSSSALPIILGCLTGFIGLIGLIALFMYRRRLKQKAGGSFIDRRASFVSMTGGLVEDQESASTLANPRDFLGNLMHRLSFIRNNSSVQLVDEEKPNKRQSKAS